MPASRDTIWPVRTLRPLLLTLLAFAAGACGGGAAEIEPTAGATEGGVGDRQPAPREAPPVVADDGDPTTREGSEPEDGEGGGHAGTADPGTEAGGHQGAATATDPLGPDAFPALSRSGTQFALRRNSANGPVVVSFHGADGERTADFVLGVEDPLLGDPVEGSRSIYERDGFRPLPEPLVLEADASPVERDGLSIGWDGGPGRIVLRQTGMARPLLRIRAPLQRLFEPAPRGRCLQTGRRVRPTAVAIWIDLERDAALVAWRWDQVTCDSLQRRFGLHRVQGARPPSGPSAHPEVGGDAGGPR